MPEGVAQGVKRQVFQAGGGIFQVRFLEKSGKVCAPCAFAEGMRACMFKAARAGAGEVAMHPTAKVRGSPTPYVRRRAWLGWAGVQLASRSPQKGIGLAVVQLHTRWACGRRSPGHREGCWPPPGIHLAWLAGWKRSCRPITAARGWSHVWARVWRAGHTGRGRRGGRCPRMSDAARRSLHAAPAQLPKCPIALKQFFDAASTLFNSFQRVYWAFGHGHRGSGSSSPLTACRRAPQASRCAAPCPRCNKKRRFRRYGRNRLCQAAGHGWNPPASSLS